MGHAAASMCNVRLAWRRSEAHSWHGVRSTLVLSVCARPLAHSVGAACPCRHQSSKEHACTAWTGVSPAALRASRPPPWRRAAQLVAGEPERPRELAWWSLSLALWRPLALRRVGRRGVAVRPGPRVVWPRAASWGPCRAMWPAVSEFRGVEAGHTPRFRPRSHPAKTRPKRPRAADRWVPRRPPRAVIFSGGSLHGPYPRIQASV